MRAHVHRARVSRVAGLVAVVFTMLLVLGLSVGLAQVRAQNGPEIICVDASFENGLPDGSCWHAPFADLQVALAEADELLDGGATAVEIWVVAGTYYPTDNPGDRTASFELRNNVEIYGGFAGTEAARDQRDWNANETILSGDIGEPGETSDNSYTVVRGIELDDTPVLDGFTITGGNSNRPGVENAVSGGGIILGLASPTLRHLDIRENYAEQSGGGIYSTLR